MKLSQKKEMKKKMLIRKTITSMDKQIKKLEEQKQVYINAAKLAKKKGLNAQFNLALTGLKMTMAQQKRVYEMKLNFEITAQMKDMAGMTTEFLGGMSTLSKEMMRLTKEKDFMKVQEQFNEAMANAENQTEMLQDFMDESSSAFASGVPTNEDNDKEIENMIASLTGSDESSVDMDSEIEKELEAIKKKLSN